MAFWTQERLTKEAEAHDLVDPFDAARIENGAYALRVAKEYAITTANGGGEKVVADGGTHITIPPGQFALLLTEESISIPDTAIGFISMKAKVKLRGLVNVSGFHVDPGFNGRLKFSVYNAGNQSLDLTPGQPLFLLWYSELDQRTKYVYTGPSQKQTGITAEDVAAIRGLIGSPAGLHARIDSLETKLSNELEAVQHRIVARLMTSLFIPVAIVFLIAIATAITAPLLILR